MTLRKNIMPLRLTGMYYLKYCVINATSVSTESHGASLNYLFWHIGYGECPYGHLEYLGKYQTINYTALPQHLSAKSNMIHCTYENVARFKSKRREKERENIKAINASFPSHYNYLIQNFPSLLCFLNLNLPFKVFFLLFLYIKFACN